MRISDWSSDVCSSDLIGHVFAFEHRDVVREKALGPEVPLRIRNADALVPAQGWLVFFRTAGRRQIGVLHPALTCNRNRMQRLGKLPLRRPRHLSIQALESRKHAARATAHVDRKSTRLNSSH